jgi:hypothetical protein
MNSIDRQERFLRITNIQEQDQGLYRCIQGDITLNEILLDVLSKCCCFFVRLSLDDNVCFYMIISLF